MVTVALRFPPVLYVGTPTILGAQTGTGVPAGSASFFFDGQGIIGSTPTDSTGAWPRILDPHRIRCAHHQHRVLQLERWLQRDLEPGR